MDLPPYNKGMRKMRVRRRAPEIDWLMKNAKNGDVVAFCGNSMLSASINLLTYGIPYFSVSHVGIVCTVGGKKLLFESLAYPSSPCVIAGKMIKGAQAHLLEEVPVNEGRVYLYPLYRELYPHEERRMKFSLADRVGSPYDVVGALRSGGWLTGIVSSRLHSENRSTLFCSEWVASTLCEVGIFPTSNISRWSPNSLCRMGSAMGIYKRPVRVV